MMHETIYTSADIALSATKAVTQLDVRARLSEEAQRTGPDRYREIMQRAVRERIQSLKQDRSWARRNAPEQVRGLTVSIDYLTSTITGEPGVPGWLQVENDRRRQEQPA